MKHWAHCFKRMKVAMTDSLQMRNSSFRTESENASTAAKSGSTRLHQPAFLCGRAVHVDVKYMTSNGNEGWTTNKAVSGISEAMFPVGGSYSLTWKEREKPHKHQITGEGRYIRLNTNTFTYSLTDTVLLEHWYYIVFSLTRFNDCLVVCCHTLAHSPSECEWIIVLTVHC